eukprot:TRINITY_DN6354_c1_g1_i1.p1 TRINITY_DN6354_c1_g1~~TRINITY_DN6354_c1_g1_i1.p1  ORF type:complete len:521 (-),score=143.54 TRINITY_DN6354_c1_g1_i1:96-1658(-)
MIIKTLVLSGLLMHLVFGEQIPHESDVLVLDTKNFDEALNTYKSLLVEFYAPWCGHCKSLEPEYAKAAGLLKEKGSEVRLAKVDATVETQLAADYKVKGFPTLKFLHDGSEIAYTGGRTAQTIVEWIEKKTSPPCVKIESKEAFDDLISSKKVAVAGFFKDLTSEKAKIFEVHALANDKMTFAYVVNKALWKEYNANESSVILFKPFDEKMNVMPEGDLTTETLKDFINENSRPNIHDFSDDSSDDVFEGEIQQYIVLFVDKERDKDVITIASTVAKTMKKQVIFLLMDVKSDMADGIVQFFGIKDTSVPTFAAFKLSNSLKYFPANKEFTEENLRSFVEDFVAGKLKPTLKSADLPEDWDSKPVKVLVASNFNEIAKDKSKDVLVEFYAPWCGHCQALAPIWDQLGDKYKDSETVVIAKMDATENELEDVEVEGFPTIKIFKKDTNDVVDYVGSRTLESLEKFVETGEQEEDVEIEEEDDFPEDFNEDDYPDDFDEEDFEGSEDDEDGKVIPPVKKDEL